MGNVTIYFHVYVQMRGTKLLFLYDTKLEKYF